MPDTPLPAAAADDKPGAARIGWRVLAHGYPFRGKFHQLREDRLAIPGRGELSYSYLERGESVIVVPVTDTGEIVLIRQYRYAVDVPCLELPAGTCADTGGMPLEEVCRKELREEIGGTAGAIESVSWFYSSSSLSDEVCHIHLAWDVKLSFQPKTEPGESIATLVVPAREALTLARRGEMRTGTCALALFLCEERLRARGVVS